MLPDTLVPQRITDLLDNIDLYLEEMRKTENKKEIPAYLKNYIWNFFRDVPLDKEKLKKLAIFASDHTYRYASRLLILDDYTRVYFAFVMTELWDSLQSRGIDTFYILDNEIREDRFNLTIQLFALSGFSVVTPYAVHGNYLKYLSLKEQADWVLSFNDKDFDPKKLTITVDSSEDMRKIDVEELIMKSMKHTRNIVYIEKDASVNYLDDVKKLAKDSKYVAIFRNLASDDPNVSLLN